ncbi:MAG: hypothetical protein NC541_13635, partial [bacterium]|nr:hypothetical protein [bacterium]
EVRDRSARDDYVREEGRMTGRAEGELKGMADAVLQLLAEKGTVPEELAQKIREQGDSAVLSAWLTAAAKAENIGDFLSVALAKNGGC